MDDLEQHVCAQQGNYQALDLAVEENQRLTFFLHWAPALLIDPLGHTRLTNFDSHEQFVRSLVPWN